MTLEITVRGQARRTHPAERAIVQLAAAVEGERKDAVLAEATAVHEPLTSQLRELVDKGAVATWSSGQISIHSHRPWAPDGTRQPLVHVARLGVRAEFTDFERLSGFVDYWAGRDGVEIGDVSWDVLARNRRGYEADVRKLAVDDAVVKAQAFADAVRRGRVTAVHLADPDMLGSSPGEPQPRLAAMSMEVGDAAGPHLELAPQEIVIQVAVDARFVAD